jgi:heat shock protein HslJ
MHLVIVMSAVALVGCARGRSELDGTQWRLSAWTLSSLDARDFTITAKFADGQISGSGGVNSYGGPYVLGPGSAFSAGPLASTEMAGPEPAMRAEGAYQTLLGQARSYRLAPGRLTLFDPGGNESLVFETSGR